MTKAKKIIAAAAAALTIGAIGTTAFASVNGFGFDFYMEDRDDLYYDISRSVYKDNGLEYANVDIDDVYNLSSKNSAGIAVVSTDIFPEDNFLTGEKQVTGRGSYALDYDDGVYRGKTYLFARIWSSSEGKVKFGGEWTP